MPYEYQFEELVKRLHRFGSSETKQLRREHRQVNHGLLSVGIKVHCMIYGGPTSKLFSRGLKKHALEAGNAYKKQNAAYCLVLPPVGNAEAAIHLLEVMGKRSRVDLFGNQKLQLQFCSPGRLNARLSALLGIAFYLGSDTIRRYEKSDFEVVCSDSWGSRLLLYDAGGWFDQEFTWWGQKDGALHLEHYLPFSEGRTDVLFGPASRLDIRNANLAATLLTHSQYQGYWEKLGKRFETELTELLGRHALSHVIEAPWVTNRSSKKSPDQDFFTAMNELSNYAFEEVARLKKKRVSNLDVRRDARELQSGILYETRLLLMRYRAELEEESYRVSEQ